MPAYMDRQALTYQLPDLAPHAYSARRRAVLLVCALLYGALMAWLCQILHALSFDTVSWLMALCAGLFLPWTVLGVVNAMLGAFLVARAPLITVDIPTQGSQTAPSAAPSADAFADFRVALVMTLRHEDVARAFARLRAMAEDLWRAGARGFAIHVLSDSAEPGFIEAEDTEFSAWQWACAGKEGYPQLHFRRRPSNVGFKAGNLHDFCAAHAHAYEAFVPLDADSYMDADVLLALRALMAARPNLGLIQTLVVGAPSRLAFARLFQFGMRAGMRSYTLGNQWWQGECGPFWGHNALVRLKPYQEHCTLPVLPGKPPLGGTLLSHDQVEACLMRKAGFEVRVLAQETGSFEDNPPDLASFMTRDKRWAQGNMQYWRLILEKRWLGGILPVSRFQLIWAVMLFIGTPAMTLFIALAALKTALTPPIAPSLEMSILALCGVYVLAQLLPKLVGYGDVLLRARACARYGGLARFLGSAALEIVASFITGAASSFATALFLLGLPFGLGTSWRAQRRDGGPFSWRHAWHEAARSLWSQTLFGLVVSGLFATKGTFALLVASPFSLAYVAAIPFAVVTQWPPLGAFLAAHDICASPEEICGSKARHPQQGKVDVKYRIFSG